MHIAITYYGIVIIPVSLRLWKSSGRLSLHSMAEGMWGLEIIVRCDENASHRIKMNSSNAVKDNKDPIDEITFHFMNASG